MDFYKYYILGWEGWEQNEHIYPHRFTNYLHKFVNQENEPIWIMQIWKLTTIKSSSNNRGLGGEKNGGSHGKQFACNAGDSGSISGSGRVPGEGNGNSLQYSGLENSTDRGDWQVTVHRLANSPTGLSDWHYRKQSTAQKTITPATETWDHLKRVLLFPGGSLCESRSVVSDQSLSGSSVHGIPQARILQWVTIPFSRRTFPRNWAWVYHIESRLSKVIRVTLISKRKKQKTKKPNLSANIRGPGSIHRETWVPSLGWEDPSKRGRLTTPVFWSGKFHGLHSTWGHKKSDTTKRLSTHQRPDPQSKMVNTESFKNLKNRPKSLIFQVLLFYTRISVLFKLLRPPKTVG